MVARKLLLIITSLACLVILQSPAEAITSSIPVQLVVPETILQIDGRASPDALVVIKEAGVTIVSTVADKNGLFSTSLSKSAGIHTISSEYTDTKGNKSQPNIQTISLQPQNTTISTVYLSPTISRGSNGPIANGSVVQIRGYTVPNSQVLLNIDYGGFVIETTSNSSGFYEFLVDSAEIGDGNHIASVTSISGVYLSDTSNSVTFQVVSNSEPTTPDIIVRPSQLPPPITSSPQDGAVIEGSEVTIYGESVLNAQINIYENNTIIGSVFADNFGKWSFKYSAISSPVTLSFEACVNGICSVLSRTLTLNFNKLSIKCSINFELDNYRYWGIATDEQLSIKPLNLTNNGIFEINWGDSVIEKLSYDQLKTNDYYYSYTNKGNFNGSITFESTAGDNCKQTRYFSVLVSEDKIDENYYNLLWLLLLIIGLLTLNYLVSKDKQNYTVQE